MPQAVSALVRSRQRPGLARAWLAQEMAPMLVSWETAVRTGTVLLAMAAARVPVVSSPVAAAAAMVWSAWVAVARELGLKVLVKASVQAVFSQEVRVTAME